MGTSLRNIFHTLAGFTIAYPIANATGLFSGAYMSIPARLIVALVGMTLLAGVCGAAYEYIMTYIDKERIPDDKDVLRTAIGGSLVSLAIFLPFSGWLSLTLIIICLLALVHDIFL